LGKIGKGRIRHEKAINGNTRQKWSMGKGLDARIYEDKGTGIKKTRRLGDTEMG